MDWVNMHKGGSGYFEAKHLDKIIKGKPLFRNKQKTHQLGRHTE
jgi:hypothetical protein